MIKYVMDNSRRYAWDGHLFLRLNNLSLKNWLNKMSYWGNCADALSLYALSDMYGVHTCVITKMKPWTTVDNNFVGTAEDVLDICQVKLAYLGDNKFGRLWKKAVKDTPSYFWDKLQLQTNGNITSCTNYGGTRSRTNFARHAKFGFS